MSATPIFSRVVWIVLDSVGIGEMPDAAAYGDDGSDTLGNIARLRGLQLPNLARLGLANISRSRSRARGRTHRPHSDAARWLRPARTPPPGIGRWRAFIWSKPFPLYPHGFPPEIMDEFERRIGRSTLGNKAASGTEIIRNWARSTCAPARPSSIPRPTASSRSPRTRK